MISKTKPQLLSIFLSEALDIAVRSQRWLYPQHCWECPESPHRCLRPQRWVFFLGSVEGGFLLATHAPWGLDLRHCKGWWSHSWYKGPGCWTHHMTSITSSLRRLRPPGKILDHLWTWQRAVGNHAEPKLDRNTVISKGPKKGNTKEVISSFQTCNAKDKIVCTPRYGNLKIGVVRGHFWTNSLLLWKLCHLLFKSIPVGVYY